MEPAKLATRVPAADRDLPALHRVADPDLEPGPDRVAVRARLLRTAAPSQWPIAAGLRRVPAPTLRQIRTGRRS